MMAANQRKYTAQFKAKVVLEVLQGEKSPTDACRTYKLHNSKLNFPASRYSFRFRVVVWSAKHFTQTDDS